MGLEELTGRGAPAMFSSSSCPSIFAYERQYLHIYLFTCSAQCSSLKLRDYNGSGCKALINSQFHETVNSPFINKLGIALFVCTALIVMLLVVIPMFAVHIMSNSVKDVLVVVCLQDSSKVRCFNKECDLFAFASVVVQELKLVSHSCEASP